MGSPNTVLDALSDMIKEELPMYFLDARQKVDPSFQSVVKSSETVTSDEIGRDYVVQHRFRTGISGHIEGAPLAEQPLSAGNLKQTLGYAAPGTYPDPAIMPHSTSFVRTLKLARHKGNFSLPAEPFQHAGLSPLILQDVADDLKGLATLRAQLEAISFYSGNKYIAKTKDAGLSTDKKRLTFTPDEARIRWFMPGMMVSLTSPEGNPLNVLTSGNTLIPLVVDAVDLLGGTVTLSTFGGSNFETDFKDVDDEVYTSEDSDWAMIDFTDDGNLVYPWAGSITTSKTYKVGHFGLDDWIKNTGTVMDMTARTRYDTSTGVFNLADFPQFKSYITALGTEGNPAPLTEKVLTKAIGTFVEAYDAEVDTFITTRGVMEKMNEQPQTPTSTGYFSNLEQSWDRTGKPLDYKAGFSAFPTYTYDGKVYKFNISPYCKPGTLYGMKMGEGNLKRYVPPAPATTGGINNFGLGNSAMGVDGELRFLNTLDGKSSVFSLTRNSNGFVESRLEAPFDQISQLAPVDIRGIKITNISEST